MMTEPGLPLPANRPHKGKAIPESRDRLQSRILVALTIFGLLIVIPFGLLATGDLGGRYQIAAVSLLFAAIVASMRSATLAGAASGALVCFSITWWTRDLDRPLLHSALPPLLCLFVLTFAATRAGKLKKLARGLAERTGGRTSAQVLANLSIAALVVTPAGAYLAHLAGLALPVDPILLASASVAALAEATADTVSSEIGQAFGEKTYMLTSFRRVHRGTDGGVSALGTSAGISAALLIVLVGTWSLRLSLPAGIIAFVAALLGFFADSLLGATLERRGWIGNDLVNFLSTAIAAFAVFLFARAVPLTR